MMEANRNESPPPKKRHITTGGMKYPKKACQYCKQELATNHLEAHEAMCKDASPDLRELRRLAREAARGRPSRDYDARLKQRESDRKRYAMMKETAALAKASLNGHVVQAPPSGKRKLVLTISVDFEMLQRLLMQLGPEGFSLDNIKFS